MSALLRPANGAADAAAFNTLRRVVTPYQVFSAERILHFWAVTPERAYAKVLVAEVDGQIVAAGRAGFNTWTSEQGAASLFVMVHPDHRRQGLGAQLYAVLEAHLAEHDARKIQVWGTDDEDVAGFLARRGYGRTAELRYSKLDLTDVAKLPPAPATPDGVALVSAREAGPEALYSVDAATVVDEPGDTAMDAVSYEDWYAEIWQNPATDHDASVVVLADGVPAAYTLVEMDRESGRMWSGGTGTLRSHRGRGLAKLAKSDAVRRAAAAGVTAAYTSNDEVNQPMLAVNEWLGYQPCAVQYSYVRTL
ncbi:GNAT superfamily N-acetyltransferase [Hamadaea flava]|uniref:GNAT family N-acetyltransferase n=1 Tax=Hamadaea flava TaxID=1742688 RepID=A0ABV8LVE5_9ACTN|nr:GNAT family N-acetyltransferase [Hamadaea flava]MCP2327794.1 GNAT superfamily N-acetyltransferase [Hamadaea flava]